MTDANDANKDNIDHTDNKPHIFSSATEEMKERLSRYGLGILPSLLVETKSVIAGSFPLQCIIDETWPDSDINIYCKHRIAYEYIEERLLSLELLEKVEITKDERYSGYDLTSFYGINYGNSYIIIKLMCINSYYVVKQLEIDFDMNLSRAYFD